jgi:uncharacterized protein (DUF305 family)
MKHINIFAALLFVCLCSAFVAVHEDLHKAMTKMMQKMESMKMSGDADHDFAMMMAEHHQGSIDMSEIIVASGKDQKIKALAQSILSKQPREQEQLRSHSKPDTHDAHAAHSSGAGTSASKGDNGFVSEMKKAMQEMKSQMTDMKMTGNLDHDFATMMIPHHQSAVDMADAEISYGKDQEIKTIAEKIKSDSQKEIAELKQWINNHK